MHAIDIRAAKMHLSRLVDRAVAGEPFIITKSGKPLVKVVRLDAPVSPTVRRIGFMQGEIAVPDDFDRMGQADIEHGFKGVA